MSKLMTLDQAAERLSRSSDTLRYWVQRGTAPKSFKIGRRRMFREEDVEAWISEQEASVA